MPEALLADSRPPRRDRRLAALALTIGLVAGGGFLLDHLGRGDPPDPMAHADRMRDDEVALRFRQGVVMLHAKQYEHAATAFHRVLALAPRLPEAHVNMGFALIGQKRYREALAFFDGATALKADQLNAYYGMAEAYEGLGDLRGALEAMETYLHRAGPDDPFRRKAESAVWEWRERLPARSRSAARQP